MARLIPVRILSDHSRTEYRKFVLVGGVVCEHAVQLLGEPLFSSRQFNQPVNVMLHRPEILPSVAFADVRSITFRVKVRESPR